MGAVKGGEDDDKIPKISGVTVGSKNASFPSLLIDPTSSLGRGSKKGSITSLEEGASRHTTGLAFYQRMSCCQ